MDGRIVIDAASYFRAGTGDGPLSLRNLNLQSLAPVISVEDAKHTSQMDFQSYLFGSSDNEHTNPENLGHLLDGFAGQEEVKWETSKTDEKDKKNKDASSKMQTCTAYFSSIYS